MGLERHVDEIIEEVNPFLKARYCWDGGLRCEEKDAKEIMKVLDECQEFGDTRYENGKIYFDVHPQFFPSLEDYRKLIKKDKCHCGFKGLKNQEIHNYVHDAGWKLRGFRRRNWLYIQCPKCSYEWALWKLGVPREP